MANRNPRKNVEATSEIKKLKTQQDIIEKNTTSLLHNLNNTFQHDDLKFFVIAMKKQSQAKKLKFQNVVQEIRTSLNTLGKKSCVLDVDLEHLRDFLFNITDNITSLKDTNQECIAKLSEQEKTAAADLESLKTRIDDFFKVNFTRPSVSVRKPLARLKPTSSHFEALIPRKLNSETDTFDRFLLGTGGHTGGWDEKDHLLFVHHRTKQRGHRLASALNAVLPDIPVEVIIQHETWFNQYESLKTQQRNAIKSWRDDRKRASATNTMTQQQPETKPRQLYNPREAQEKKCQILEWKTRKQEEQLAEQEARKLERRRQSDSVEMRTRKEQERQRRAVAEYKKKKRMEEEAEQARREAQLQDKDHVMDKKLLLMFRERDRATVASSLLRVQQERQAKIERARHSGKVFAERDPARLLRATEGWKNRVKLYEGSSRETQPVHLGNLPRLKIPSWRKTAA